MGERDGDAKRLTWQWQLADAVWHLPSVMSEYVQVEGGGLSSCLEGIDAMDVCKRFKSPEASFITKACVKQARNVCVGICPYNQENWYSSNTRAQTYTQ